MYPRNPLTLCTWPGNSNMTRKYMPYGQRSLLSSYKRLILRDLTLPFSATCPLESQNHMFQLHSAKSFSTVCSPFHTRAFDKHKNYCQMVSSGMGSTKMFAIGLAFVTMSAIKNPLAYCQPHPHFCSP